MRRALAAVALAALALAGCSTSGQQSAAPDKSSSSTGSGASTQDPGAKSAVIDVKIAGDTVEPNGERVKVGVGEPVTLRVRSDRAAELHVHSSPEQELEVKKGESRVRFTVKTPGVVEVEEHHSGIVLLQLEVS